jgi:hypothetical protein
MFGGRVQHRKVLCSFSGLVGFALGAVILMLMLNVATANLEGELPRLLHSQLGWNVAGVFFVVSGFLLMVKGIRK